MIVDILAIHDFLQKQFDIGLELLADSVIICNTKQVLELCKDILVLSWVKSRFFLALQLLYLEEELGEIISTRHLINIYRKDGLKGLEAFGVLAHSTIMYWVSLQDVLCGQNLPIPINDIPGVSSKQIEHSDVEIFMSFDGVWVMEN